MEFPMEFVLAPDWITSFFLIQHTYRLYSSMVGAVVQDICSIRHTSLFDQGEFRGKRLSEPWKSNGSTQSLIRGPSQIGRASWTRSLAIRTQGLMRWRLKSNERLAQGISPLRWRICNNSDGCDGTECGIMRTSQSCSRSAPCACARLLIAFLTHALFHTRRSARRSSARAKTH